MVQASIITKAIIICSLCSSRVEPSLYRVVVESFCRRRRATQNKINEIGDDTVFAFLLSELPADALQIILYIGLGTRKIATIWWSIWSQEETTNNVLQRIDYNCGGLIAKFCI